MLVEEVKVPFTIESSSPSLAAIISVSGTGPITDTESDSRFAV